MEILYATKDKRVGLWAKQHRMPPTLHTIAWAQARTSGGYGPSPNSELLPRKGHRRSEDVP